jgi:hypothetical protein
VLGHHNVSVHTESVLLSNSFQCGFEESTGCDAFEIWPSVITAESKEVELARFVEALQSPWHWGRLSLQLG